MVSVKDEWVAEVSNTYLKRDVAVKPIFQIKEIDYPKFIKPVTPKLFKSDIFNSETELKTKIGGINEEELLICSEVVEVNKEVRSFILDNKVKDLAFYEGDGSIEEPRRFIRDFLAKCELDLPRTFVLDVGFNEKSGWFIIEFNSTWGAGLNYCKPENVIDCIREATINL